MFNFLKSLKKNFTVKGDIKKNVVQSYFNKTTSLMFDAASASYEEDAILKNIKNIKNKTILDLGCGDGRYESAIQDYMYYHGVDFSESFIAKCVEKKNSKFTCHDVSTFIEDKKYNIILLVGIITYLEDEDIIKLTHNLKRMITEDGIIILRSVSLQEDGYKKIYYDSKRGYLNRLRFLKPRYQIIRGTKDYEMNLFKDFKIIKITKIPNTSYTLYIFQL